MTEIKRFTDAIAEKSGLIILRSSGKHLRRIMLLTKTEKHASELHKNLLELMKEDRKSVV